MTNTDHPVIDMKNFYSPDIWIHCPNCMGKSHLSIPSLGIEGVRCGYCNGAGVILIEEGMRRLTEHTRNELRKAIVAKVKAVLTPEEWDELMREERS